MVIYSRADDNVSLELLLRNSITMVEREKAMGKKNLEAIAPEPLPPVEEVAKAITEIAAGMKKMNSSRLRQDAIVILLQAQCGTRVNRSQIRMVLNELSRMDKAWLKPLEKKEGK